MRILVIGGTSGIGQACVDLLVNRSTKHHEVTAPSREELDVRSTGSILAFRNSTPEPFDALIYSAGINHLKWHNDIEIPWFNEVMDVNATGFLRVMKSLDRDMLQKVVVIGSDAADSPMRTSIAYNASKAALHAMARVVARELAEDGIAVNIVAPGKIELTNMTDEVAEMTRRERGWTVEALRTYELSKIPMGRYGNVHEVAEVVRWLIDDAPGYMTGETIKVNGGR